MRLPSPKMPRYDVRDWARRPWPERVRMVCEAWAEDGYGTPWTVYLVYLLKVGLYVGGWWLACAFTAGGAPIDALARWATTTDALGKAVLWSMLFEVLGLGCGSGPLTGRYVPPVAAVLHFARPGTIKLPLFPGLPLVGGDRRRPIDALLYLLHLALLVRALAAPSLGPEVLLPPIVLLPLLALTDKTLFVASRAEHFLPALVCLLFPADALAGLKVVWMAVWWWAATSKLNRHFPSVIAVMQSNSPLTQFGGVRRLLFRDAPRDLRPSRLAHVLAHAGTITEYSFPLLLAVSRGGTPTLVGLVVMTGFHAFITSSVPMGVPIEWNVIMVYGGFVLFGAHAGVNALSIASPALIVFLLCALVLWQVWGNVSPAQVSFLPSMRYYAGNWAFSVWLFRGDASKRLDEKLVKAAPHVREQLRRFYDEDVITAALSKVIAFRAMHLHGRALEELIPRAVPSVDDYEYLDGEIVAGLALGWNFGDGHLHDEQLLSAIQARCGFEEGELRCIFVESQPIFRPRHAWRIVDAKAGELARGEIAVDTLLARQPWPAGEGRVAPSGPV